MFVSLHIAPDLTCSFFFAAVGLASSAALMVNWLSAFVVGQVFPLMSTGLGSYAFLPFACYLVFAFVITIIFIPETKGKLLSQIQKDMGFK